MDQVWTTCWETILYVHQFPQVCISPRSSRISNPSPGSSVLLAFTLWKELSESPERGGGGFDFECEVAHAVVITSRRPRGPKRLRFRFRLDCWLPCSICGIVSSTHSHTTGWVDIRRPWQPAVYLPAACEAPVLLAEDGASLDSPKDTSSNR